MITAGTLSKKIDFAVIIKVTNANPNGDPLNENIPRITSDGFGEMTDVCIKRKIRNRLLDLGEDILVQSDDYKAKGDTFSSIRERLEDGIGKISSKKKKDNKNSDKANDTEEEYTKKACSKWIDVRSFGQVIAWDKLSIGIRGPVSIQSAFSIDPIDQVSLQITKSTNNEPELDKKKGSDTMGMKHRITKGIYVFYGAINPQLAEKTGFTNDDAEKIKQVLPKLFENDESSARPAGSMEVLKVIWWKHDSKSGQYSSAKVHRSLEICNNEKALKDGLEEGQLINEKALKDGSVKDVKDLIAEILDGR
jgi:CRISPR-associated protein Csd2